MNTTELVARLEALPEDRILDYFWLMVRKTSERLTVLSWLSQVKVARPPDWSCAKIRREHERNAAGVTLDRRECFGCGQGGRALYAHHILEVQHGGSNQVRNKVPLCFQCHKFLHPWLTEEAPVRTTRGLEVIGDIAPRALQEVAGAEESA